MNFKSQKFCYAMYKDSKTHDCQKQQEETVKCYLNTRQDTTNILYIKTKIVMFKTETNVRLMS
jgi:hypothetical protein